MRSPREPGDACDAVARAVQLGDAQRRVAVRATVLDGRHPSGYRTMRSYLDGERQFVVLDDRGYGPGALGGDDELRGRANGMAELAPERERDCERVREARVDEHPAIEFAYVGAAERGESRITLWVDAASGLPLRALIVAPELVYSRVLSRPTKPPQVTLKATGRRYRELREFRYGDEADFPTEKRTP